MTLDNARNRLFLGAACMLVGGLMLALSGVAAKRAKIADAKADTTKRATGGGGAASVVGGVRHAADAWVAGGGKLSGTGKRRYPRSTNPSITRFSPAWSKATVSLSLSTAMTVPGPNFWWKTRSPGVKGSAGAGRAAVT